MTLCDDLAKLNAAGKAELLRKRRLEDEAMTDRDLIYDIAAQTYDPEYAQAMIEKGEQILKELLKTGHVENTTAD